MQITNIIPRYNLVPLLFTQVDLAASQTAVALLPVEATGSGTGIGYCMPWSGYIVGVSLTTTAAATAGSLAITPTIDTTVVSDPTVSITTAVYASDTAPRNATPFAKNAVIGCKITTAAGWDGTGADLVAQVWVLLKISEI